MNWKAILASHCSVGSQKPLKDKACLDSQYMWSWIKPKEAEAWHLFNHEWFQIFKAIFTLCNLHKLLNSWVCFRNSQLLRLPMQRLVQKKRLLVQLYKKEGKESHSGILMLVLVLLRVIKWQETERREPKDLADRYLWKALDKIRFELQESDNCGLEEPLTQLLDPSKCSLYPVSWLILDPESIILVLWCWILNIVILNPDSWSWSLILDPERLWMPASSDCGSNGGRLIMGGGDQGGERTSHRSCLAR